MSEVIGEPALLGLLHGRHGLPVGVAYDLAGILHATAQRRNAGLKALVDGGKADKPCPCCPSTTLPGVGRWAKRSSPTCFAWNVELSGCACVAIVLRAGTASAAAGASASGAEKARASATGLKTLARGSRTRVCRRGGRASGRVLSA